MDKDRERNTENVVEKERARKRLDYVRTTGWRPGEANCEGVRWRHDQHRGLEVRMCSHKFMIVLPGVVLRERTFLKQPAQVLGSQDVGVSGPMIAGGWQYSPVEGIAWWDERLWACQAEMYKTDWVWVTIDAIFPQKGVSKPIQKRKRLGATRVTGRGQFTIQIGIFHEFHD